MKAGNFTGITGIPNQDMAMWISMGRIADRSLDRLGASDMAIVEFRKQMVEAVQAFQKSGEVIGGGENRIPNEVCSFQGVIPKTVDWRAYETSYVWLEGQDNPEMDRSYVVTA
jgi:phthalate 4,5-dioxygenase oxygenase subunit